MDCYDQQEEGIMVNYWLIVTTWPIVIPAMVGCWLLSILVRDAMDDLGIIVGCSVDGQLCNIHQLGELAAISFHQVSPQNTL